MFQTFAILDLSTPDLVIILAIILLLFGGKKLPELSRSLGQSAKELKKGLSDMTDAHDDLKKHVSDTKESLEPKTPNSQQEQDS